MSLQDELTKLDEQIEKVKIELEELSNKTTLLRARLAGLNEERRALATALSDSILGGARAVNSGPGDDITKLPMVRAVKKVVNDANRPMRISEVVRTLQEHGRNDKPNSVSVTLNYLAKSGDIQCVERGVYGPLD